MYKLLRLFGLLLLELWAMLGVALSCPTHTRQHRSDPPDTTVGGWQVGSSRKGKVHQDQSPCIRWPSRLSLSRDMSEGFATVRGSYGTRVEHETWARAVAAKLCTAQDLWDSLFSATLRGPEEPKTYIQSSDTTARQRSTRPEEKRAL